MLFAIVFTVLLSVSFIEPVYSQIVVQVNETAPCFLNYTAGYNIINNCNASDDYIGWILSGWMWITGGYFPMIIVSLIIGLVYAKYQQAIFAIYIGIVFLPISFMFFPDVFLSWGIIMAFTGVGILIWWALVRQTE